MYWWQQLMTPIRKISAWNKLIIRYELVSKLCSKYVQKHVQKNNVKLSLSLSCRKKNSLHKLSLVSISILQQLIFCMNCYIHIRIYSVLTIEVPCVFYPPGKKYVFIHKKKSDLYFLENAMKNAKCDKIVRLKKCHPRELS